MKRSSTLFLKIAVILIGVPVLALCLFLLPQIAGEANEAARRGSDLAYVVYGILLIMYITTIPFYFALFQAFKLRKDNKFLIHRFRQSKSHFLSE